MTIRKILSLAMAACLLLGAVALAETTLSGDAPVDGRNYPSTAPFIHPPFYNVRLAIDVDEQGVITAVRDDGTGMTGSVQAGKEEAWAKKNKPFWEMALDGGLLERFVGKTQEQVAQMDMLGMDAISGATMVGAAAQEAVLNAFAGRAGKTFLALEGSALPVLSVEGGVVTMQNALPTDFDLALLDVRWGVRNEQIVPAEAYTAEITKEQVVLRFADPAALRPGYYYVNVVDRSGTYRAPDFEGGPGSAAAPCFVVDSGLAPEDVAFDGQAVTLRGAEIADFLANLEHVQILAEGAEKATEQAIIGHHGTPGQFIALDEAGVLNADGVVKARSGEENPLFAPGVPYTVTVSAFGYPELTFSYEKPAM